MRGVKITFDTNPLPICFKWLPTAVTVCDRVREVCFCIADTNETDTVCSFPVDRVTALATVAVADNVFSMTVLISWYTMEADTMQAAAIVRNVLLGIAADKVAELESVFTFWQIVKSSHV